MFDFAQNQTHFCTTTITHQKLLHDVRVCVDSTSVFERVNQRFQYGVFFSIRKLINFVTHCLAIVVFQSLLGAFFSLLPSVIFRLKSNGIAEATPSIGLEFVRRTSLLRAEFQLTRKAKNKTERNFGNRG